MSDIYTEITNLPPSTEILEFYREKIKEHDKDKEELLTLLEMYRRFGSSSVAEKEREQLVNDLAELKSALSDVNVFIHAERQQVANLHLENEKLKAEQKLLEKKISFLLHVCGFSEDQLTAYLRASRKREIVHQLSFANKKKGNVGLLNKLKDTEPSEIELFLKNKVKLMDDHFRIAKSSWEEEKNVLLEERTLQKAEAKAQRDHDQAHINLLNAKLEDAQRLIAESTKKAVEAKTEMHKSKNLWVAEKDKLMMDMQILRGKLTAGENVKTRRSVSFGDLTAIQSTCEAKQLKRELSAAKRELTEAEEMKSLFESRCRNLEKDLSKLREQRDAQQAIFKDKLRKLTEAKELLTRQRDRTEERRRRQMEGFFSELKMVKNDLRKVVHQFFKLTRFYSESQDLPNVAELKDLKLATALARNIHHAIIDAKRNMINVEKKCRSDTLEEN